MHYINWFLCAYMTCGQCGIQVRGGGVGVIGPVNSFSASKAGHLSVLQ